MRLSVEVHFDHASHRFLRRTEVTLRAGASEQSLASVQPTGQLGAQRFRIDNASEGMLVEVHIRVPAPEDMPAEPPEVVAPHPPLVDITQRFHVEVAHGAAGQAAVRLAPDGELHIRLIPSSVASVSHGTNAAAVHLRADLDFLDVTRYAVLIDRARARSGTSPRPHIAEEYFGLPRQLPVTAVPPPPDHAGVSTRILEYAGLQPATWVAMVPEMTRNAVRSGGPVRRMNAWVFFKPQGMDGTYENTSAVDLSALSRYMRGADVQTAGLFVNRLAQPGGQLVAGRTVAHRWIQHPRCGWLQQLAHANRNVVLVWPQADDGNFREAEQAGLTRRLLPSLFRALLDHLNLGGMVEVGRIGIGGFSFGGSAAFTALGQNRRAVDELYLFDTIGTGAHIDEVVAWQREPEARPNGGRRVRMFVGQSAGPEYRAIYDQLGASPRVSLSPSTAAFWHDDPAFLDAVSLRPDARSFSSVTQRASPNEPSADTGVYLAADDPSGVRLAAFVGGHRVVAEVPQCAPEVATGLVWHAWFVSGPMTERDSHHLRPPAQWGQPVTTAAELEQAAAFVREQHGWVRHQWTVAGGVQGGPGAPFVGHLEFCLQNSGY
jgi:hypothetical protein